MKKVLGFIKNNIIGFIAGLIIAGSIGVYAVSVVSSDVTYDNTNSGSSATTVEAAIDDLYSKTNVGNATAGDIRAGKTALVNGVLVTGTGEMNETPYIYEATLYCGWWTNNSETLWGNWSGNMTITDETGATVATAAVGTSRSQMYSFVGGDSGTKSVRFSVPRRSVEEKTYTISLSCGWWTNYGETLWGNWSGSATVNDVTGVSPVGVKSIGVGTSRSQMYSFNPASASGSTSGTFNNK